jgi:hypothetical protein
MGLISDIIINIASRLKSKMCVVALVLITAGAVMLSIFYTHSALPDTNDKDLKIVGLVCCGSGVLIGLLHCIQCKKKL